MTLPDELVKLIFVFFVVSADRRDLIHAARVCKSWFRYVSQFLNQKFTDKILKLHFAQYNLRYIGQETLTTTDVNRMKEEYIRQPISSLVNGLNITPNPKIIRIFDSPIDTTVPHVKSILHGDVLVCNKQHTTANQNNWFSKTTYNLGVIKKQRNRSKISRTTRLPGHLEYEKRKNERTLVLKEGNRHVVVRTLVKEKDKYIRIIVHDHERKLVQFFTFTVKNGTTELVEGSVCDAVAQKRKSYTVKPLSLSIFDYKEKTKKIYVGGEYKCPDLSKDDYCRNLGTYSGGQLRKHIAYAEPNSTSKYYSKKGHLVNTLIRDSFMPEFAAVAKHPSWYLKAAHFPVEKDKKCPLCHEYGIDSIQKLSSDSSLSSDGSSSSTDVKSAKSIEPIQKLSSDTSSSNTLVACSPKPKPAQIIPSSQPVDDNVWGTRLPGMLSSSSQPPVLVPPIGSSSHPPDGDVGSTQQNPPVSIHFIAFAILALLVLIPSGSFHFVLPLILASFILMLI
jgi:hypothetical protein